MGLFKKVFHQSEEHHVDLKEVTDDLRALSHSLKETAFQLEVQVEALKALDIPNKEPE